MRVVLPGSYDPVTVGHLDIIRRAAEKYEEVYVVIFANPNKTYTFSLDDRVRMLMIATEEYDNVLVSWSAGLVIDYMREHGIEKIIKGYRTDADLPWEREQAEYNRKHGYETELILCDEQFKDISSTLVREKIKKGESLDGLVPDSVRDYILSL